MELSFLVLDLAYLDPSTSCRRLYTPHSEQTDHRNFEQVDKTTKNPQSCVCRGASKIWGAHGYCDLPCEEIKTHCVRRQSIIRGSFQGESPVSLDSQTSQGPVTGSNQSIRAEPGARRLPCPARLLRRAGTAGPCDVFLLSALK